MELQRTLRAKCIGEVIHLQLKVSKKIVELGVERKIVGWLPSSVEG